MQMSDKVAVIIPAYRVAQSIVSVVQSIPHSIGAIYVVDDCCPEASGRVVDKVVKDPRVNVINNDRNLGVGGATLTGYRIAYEDGADIAVKLDGDGQMDATLIPELIDPLVRGDADYVKGNRFYFMRSLRGMPRRRLFGNAVLSFVAKFTTGYWNIMDPTNGFTALRLELLPFLETEKIHSRYFFETDMLFRLGLLRAVVQDYPMDARYGDENSSLSLSTALFTFSFRHLRNFFKRIFYVYFLRDFSAGTIQLISGIACLTFGIVFGSIHWLDSVARGEVASAGTVMVAGLPIMVGIQLLISAINWDISSTPTRPIHPFLRVERLHASNRKK
jgi:dolichol-phosphate mannosyltransferase